MVNGRGGSRRPGALRRAARRWRGAFLAVERTAFPALLIAIVGLGASTAYVGPQAVPPGVLLLPLLVGGFLLRVGPTRALIAATATMAVLMLVRLGVHEVRVGNLVATGVAAVIADRLASARRRIGGMPGLRGETMLLELRDKLREHGELPPLPPGWGADVALESAGGASFGGDFVVSAATGRATLEIALVDVSGKGVDAGTRALLLSGAFGGLLGAVPPDRFLPEANHYLRRQDWEEGFATAVHLILDLATGDYRLETAGHPPAVQYDAGSGRWRISQVHGVALGLLDEPVYDVEAGRLRGGDALLLYTDGVVEIPGRDLSLGIDKLLGEAERLIPLTFAGGASWLLDAMRSRATDDRALLLIWRR